MFEPMKSTEVHLDVVARVNTTSQVAECILADGRSVLVPKRLSNCVVAGDTLEFPLPDENRANATEILVYRASNSRRDDVYQAPIGYRLNFRCS